MRRGAAIIFAFLVSIHAFADKEIILKDGSRIRGEIQSMQNGLYEVRTDSMGTIQLGSRQIQSIISVGTEAPGAAAGEQGSAVSQSTIDSIKSNIVSSPGMMSTITELQNDPQMKAVLADPEIMRAVQNFDLQALGNNPKIKALMNNAKIKQISNEVN